MTFEESYKKIEESIEKLEKGELSLEESIQEFTQGMQQIAYAQNLLNKAEKDIQTLIEKDGQLTTAPIEIDEEKR